METGGTVTFIARPNLLVSLGGPLMLVLLAYLSLPWLDALPPILLELLPDLPYLILLLLFLLGVVYRAQVATAALLLALGYWSYQRILALPPESADLYYGALALLLPLNLAWVIAQEDHGGVSRHEVMPWVLILLQLLGTVMILRLWPGPAFNVLAFEIVVDLPLSEHTPLTQLGMLSAAAGLGWAVINLIRRRTLIDGGLLGAMSAVVLTLQLYPDPKAAAVLFLCAGGLLGLTVAYHAYYLAYMDELTGLPGRRAFNETLERLKGHYAVAMLDVDHFKSFNDTYGHDVGDQVLKMVAARLRRVGAGGKPFRYGGEEFAIIFPRKLAMNTAFQQLSALRVSVDRSHLVLRSEDRPKKRPKNPTPPSGPVKQVHVTISIGMCLFDPARHQHPEDVLKDADQALYAAKQRGRNRVVIAGLDVKETTVKESLENPAPRQQQGRRAVPRRRQAQ